MRIQVPLFFVFVCALSFLSACQESADFLTIESENGRHEVQIEVARSDEEKRSGLMGRTELGDNNGMLFVYEDGSKPVMWMKNMRMPIDILFIGSDRTVVHVESNTPPCQKEDEICERYSSSEPSSWVLEMPAGYVKRKGIKVGDSVSLFGVE